MTMYCTVPQVDSLRVLPGKDDNFITFYSNNSADYVTYPGFYYKLVWSINSLPITQVYQSLGMHSDGTLVRVVVNLKDVVENYLSTSVKNNITTPQQSNNTELIRVGLTIYGCYRTSQGEQIIDSIIAINTNNPIYFYNGESFSFWEQKDNKSKASNYMPHGDSSPENRGTWLGPLKPNIYANTVISSGRGVIIKETCKNEAYEIDTESNRTVSAFIIKNDGSSNVLAYDYIRLIIYDKKGRVSRFGLMQLSDITTVSVGNSILTIPVGIPQLNSLMVSNPNPVTGKFNMQYYIYDAGIPDLEISPSQDSYYQIQFGRFYHPDDVGLSITSVPLTFKITPICIKDKEKQYDFTNLKNLSILYYSRLGGWWQIPCYNTFNKKEISNKNTIRKSPIVSKDVYSANKHVVTTQSEDTYILYTNWLNNREVLEVEDMLESPIIYLVSGQKYIPVIISDVKTEIDTTNNRNLKSYTFEFEAAYYKNTIK